MKKGLYANQIKYIVIIAMLVDHIAWLFIPFYSFAGQAMHFVGRLTGPTMAVLIAEGYRYTKDVNKYMIRLGVFALISWPCYCLMDYGRITAEFGVIYTLFLSLLAIRVCDSDIHIVLKVLLTALLFWLSRWGDWAYFDILFALTAHIWYDKKEIRWTVHTAICIVDVVITAWLVNAYDHPVYYATCELGTLLVAPMFIFLYNGERGSKKPFHKWFFYVFYPLHMLVLWVIAYKLQ